MSEWTTTTLKDICEPMNGIWKGVKEPFISAKILRATNFSKDCKLKLDDVAIIDVEKKKLDSRRLQRGDIVVEKSGGGPNQPVGRVILFNLDDGDYSFCNFTSALRIKDKSKVLPEFLYKYLVYLYFEGETEKYQSNLVGFRNLDFKGYTSMVVRFPNTISEQQRIVDLLDKEFEKIDRLRSNAELNLCHAKDLFQAALKKELEPKDGWKSFLLGQVSDIARGGSPRPIKSFITEDPNGIRWIKIGDTEVGGKYISSTKERIKKEGMKSSRYVKAGDFLLSNSMSFGRPYILKVDGCIHDGWLVIREYEKTFTQDFLYYLLLSPIVAKQFEEGARGSTVRNLNTDTVSAVRVSIPLSHSEQREIVATLDSLNAKCKVLQDNYTKTIALCDDLKQALLRKAFNGEL